MTMTLKEMRDIIISDLDLEDEDFVDADAIDKHINKGVRKAERAIKNLYEDYFLDSTTVPISYGSNLVDYPSDIYAMKVRRIFFRRGIGGDVESHVVHREKDLIKAVSRDIYSSDSTTAFLTWHPVNSLSGGKKIRVFPETGRDGFLEIWYIRKARTLSADTDVSDIEEFDDYVIQVAKRSILLNDGDPRAEDEKALEEELESELVGTLSDMAPDEDNAIDPDVSHYNAMSDYEGDC